MPDSRNPIPIFHVVPHQPDCKIDPADREGSIQRCLKTRESLSAAAAATTTESADSWLAESADSSKPESATSLKDESVTSSEVKNDSVEEETRKKVSGSICFERLDGS